jgi:hypothetical protein
MRGRSGCIATHCLRSGSSADRTAAYSKACGDGVNVRGRAQRGLPGPRTRAPSQIIHALALRQHSISELADWRGLSLPAIHKHIQVLQETAKNPRSATP